MKKSKSKILLVISLIFIILISILQIKSLATNTDIIIVKENDNQYLIYINDMLNQKFEFAFSNSNNETNLNYITSEKDNEGKNIGYVNEALKTQFFNEENTYIWVRLAEDKTMIVDGEKIDLNNAKTVTELKKIENITKNITIDSKAETEKIKITASADGPYYYKMFVVKLSEDYNKLLTLVNKINEFDENTDTFTKLQSYIELNELYNSLKPSVDDENWAEAINNEITKPYGAKESSQYVLWLKDNKGNIDIQFLTAYEKEITIVEEKEKTEEITTVLPTTYDNTTNLFIALGLVIIAIIVIIAFKIVKKKAGHNYEK